LGLLFPLWLCSGNIKGDAKTKEPLKNSTGSEWPTKGERIVPLTIEIEQEDDGRWLAEVPELPGVLTYG